VRQREAPAAGTASSRWAAALVEPLEAAAKERQIVGDARGGKEAFAEIGTVA
jgi:hypothetical protein